MEGPSFSEKLQPTFGKGADQSLGFCCRWTPKQACSLMREGEQSQVATIPLVPTGFLHQSMCLLILFFFWHTYPKTGRPPVGFKTQLAGYLQEDKYTYWPATDS